MMIFGSSSPSTNYMCQKYLPRNHPKYDDRILLANAIFIVRRTIQTYSGSPDRHRHDILAVTSRTLGSLCKFNIQHASRGQRHEFCSLWNQLVDIAQNDSHPHLTPLFTMILKSIRTLYVALHERTIASPTPFFTTTTTDDDEDPVLDDVVLYPICTLLDIVPPYRFRNCSWTSQTLVQQDIHHLLFPVQN